jgi:putative transposase
MNGPCASPDVPTLLISCLSGRTALALVRAYDTIYYENLQTANMLKNHPLAKSIADAGWGGFLSILVFKAVYDGKQAVAVSPTFTSQRCPNPSCGREVWKGLSVRWHRCPDCGTSPHRDHNAARNILRLGKQESAVGQTAQARTWRGAACVA